MSPPTVPKQGQAPIQKGIGKYKEQLLQDLLSLTKPITVGKAFVVFKTKEGDVHAYEKFLKMHSPVFKAELESSKSLPKTIVVDEYGMTSIKRMVEYVTTGRIVSIRTESYTFDEARELLDLSKKYCMPDLLKLIEIKLCKEHITLEHLPELLQLGKQDGSLALLNSQVNQLIDRSPQDFISSKSFMDAVANKQVKEITLENFKPVKDQVEIENTMVVEVLNVGKDDERKLEKSEEYQHPFSSNARLA